MLHWKLINFILFTALDVHPDEDESFKAALNLSTAVAALDFYGAGKLWCTTGTETLHLWEWQAACMEETSGGQTPLAELEDAREQLSALSPALQEGVDYLLGCSFDAATDMLCLAAGTLTGEVALYPVADTLPPGAPKASHLGGPLCLLGGAHSDIVRCAVPVGAGRMVTGGEDARICLWDLAGNSQGQSPSTSGASTGGGPKHTRRANPY